VIVRRISGRGFAHAGSKITGRDEMLPAPLQRQGATFLTGDVDAVRIATHQSFLIQT
jgi:hypothetical protein